MSMRVLHILDAAGRQTSPVMLAMISAGLGRMGQTEQQVLLCGPTRLRRMMQADDLNDFAAATAVHAVPQSRSWSAWRSLGRLVRQHGPFDVIHAWSIGALAVSTLLFRDIPRLCTLTIEPTSRTAHWLRMLCLEASRSGAPTILTPTSATIARALLSAGAPQANVAVLRPGIDLSWIQSDQRDSLRQSWGIEPQADKQTKVFALLSDPHEDADAYFAAMSINIAQESRPNVDCRLLAHPDQRLSRPARRMLRDTRGVDRIIFEPQLSAPWRVLPGCDAVLALGPSGGGLPLLWAMAANTPIIGHANYTISEIVEDRHSALLIAPGPAQTVARRILQLFDEPILSWRLRDTARHEAYSFFSRQRYCQSLQGVYEQLTQGLDACVPEMESTGGLRFAGRA